MAMEHEIIRRVSAAQHDPQAADELIRDYIPFIQSEAAKHKSGPCTPQDDEYSIAMIAFHEAILGHERSRGAFLPYAAMVIRSRLVDFQRREARHRGHLSLHTPQGEDGHELIDELADDRDHYEESALREATRQEIEELSRVMAQFGVSFSDVADNCPRQERTMGACAAAIRAAGADRQILDELLRTKKLPMGRLVLLASVERKTLERHRKYILAMLLIQTNGYEIIRSHLRRVLKGKEGAAK